MDSIVEFRWRTKEDHEQTYEDTDILRGCERRLSILTDGNHLLSHDRDRKHCEVDSSILTATDSDGCRNRLVDEVFERLCGLRNQARAEGNRQA